MGGGRGAGGAARTSIPTQVPKFLMLVILKKASIRWGFFAGSSTMTHWPRFSGAVGASTEPSEPVGDAGAALGGIDRRRKATRARLLRGTFSTQTPGGTSTYLNLPQPTSNFIAIGCSHRQMVMNRTCARDRWGD